MKQSIVRISAAVALVWFVVAGSVIGYAALQTQRRAERLLREVEALHFGEANLRQALDLAGQFNGRVWDADRCQVATCSIQIRRQ